MIQNDSSYQLHCYYTWKRVLEQEYCRHAQRWLQKFIVSPFVSPFVSPLTKLPVHGTAPEKNTLG